MDYNKRTLWIGIIIVYLVSPHDLAKDIKVASVCYNALGRKLELKCDSSDATVISIQWNATLFGLSICDGETNCCPNDTDCTILVMDVDNFDDDHLEQLNDCNGLTTCSVLVQRVNHICSLVTDYENVTYHCIPPETSTSQFSSTYMTTPIELSPTTASFTALTDVSSTAPTTASSAASTTASSTVSIAVSSTLSTTASSTASSSSPEQSSGVVHSSSTMGGNGNPDDSETTVIIVAVLVGTLLLIIILAAIIYICYRRNKDVPDNTDVEYSDSIKRGSCQDKTDRTYIHLSGQFVDSNKENDKADRISTISAPSNTKKPAPPPPSRTVDENCNAKPIIQTSNGRPPVPAKSCALHAKPASMERKPREEAEKNVDSLEGDETDPEYSYTYAHFKQPQGTPYYNPSFTGQTETNDTQIIYADMLHAQNAEYIDNNDDDEMVLTDNDLYNVRGDDTHATVNSSKRHFHAEDDDNDMVLTDNDLYNVRTENCDNEDSSTAKKPELQTEDDDDDVVLTDNDLYHVTVPSEDPPESRSGPKQAGHQPEDDDDMVLMDNDLYNVRIEPERPIDDPDDMILMDNELYS